MTCIVALKTRDKIIFGGDGRVAVGGEVHSLKHPKVWEKFGMLWGVAGNLRVMNIIQHHITIPKREYDSSLSAEKFANKVVLRELRETFRELEFMKYDGGAEYINSRILFTVDGHIFFLDTDMSVTEFSSDYCSIGTGAPYALGSLYTTENWGLSGEERVHKALLCAGNFSEMVAPPYNFVTHNIFK